MRCHITYSRSTIWDVEINEAIRTALITQKGIVSEIFAIIQVVVVPVFCCLVPFFSIWASTIVFFVTDLVWRHETRKSLRNATILPYFLRPTGAPMF
jgi:hypothetical protein